MSIWTIRTLGLVRFQSHTYNTLLSKPRRNIPFKNNTLYSVWPKYCRITVRFDI